MRTLVVKYTARGDQSYTKKLLDCFLNAVKGTEIETLDLTNDKPDMFMPDNLAAYIQRNYMGQEIPEDLKRSIAKMDRMTEQFKKADIVVLATPMYNFSLPATVKAWFDSIMLKGETWDIRDGKYVGLMNDRKALILMASGGVYKEKMESWEHAMSLAKVEFQFMGFGKVKGVMAQGMNAMPDKADEIVGSGKREIEAIVNKWYR